MLDEKHLTELLLKLQEREAKRRAKDQNAVAGLLARQRAAETAMKGLLETAKLAPSLATQPVYRKEVELTADELRVVGLRLADALSRETNEDEITPEKITVFRTRMDEVLLGPNRAVAKVYLSAIVSEVEVEESCVTVYGHVSDLKDSIANSTDPSSGENNVPEVRRYERRWRAMRDTDRHDIYSIALPIEP